MSNSIKWWNQISLFVNYLMAEIIELNYMFEMLNS